MKKRISSMIIAVVLLVGLLPTTAIDASAENTHTHNIAESFWEFDAEGHWHKCIAHNCEIENYATEKLTETAYSVHEDDNNDGICDVCDYHFAHDHEGWTELTEELLSESYDLNDGKYFITDSLDTTNKINILGNVSICLNGKTVKALADTANIFCVVLVSESGSLNLYDCSEGHAGTLTGGIKRFGSGITVNGTLRMFGGTVKENNTHLKTDDDFNGNGAAIYVNGAEFSLYDGVIAQNVGDWGGGVYTVENSVFNMYGGLISDNTARGRAVCAGGGVCASGKEFNMYGGTIGNNKTRYRGGGVYVGANTVFNMYGGELCYNGFTENPNSGVHGGGVSFNGSFNMYGGSIHNNTSIYGGGVASFYTEKSFNMYGGEICQNIADYGGGVLIGKVNVSGESNPKFNMYGGTVYQNEAKNVGGVYVGKMGSFGLSGGSIVNNSSTDTLGGGVLIDSDSTLFTLSGDPTISQNKCGTENSNLVLVNKSISLNGKLSLKNPIGITRLDKGEPFVGVFTAGWSTYMANESFNEFFASDNSVLDIRLSSDGTEVELSNEHIDENKDHACDYGCSYMLGNHEDGSNLDHKCDYCKQEGLGDHADGDDFDHLCDYCNQSVNEECYDNHPKDHVCDECGAEKITAHTDSKTDTDHLCDNGCGATLEACTPSEDDGDCTTDVKCSICADVITKGAAAHTDENSDGKCDICEYAMPVTTATSDEVIIDGSDGTGAVVGIAVTVVAVLGLGGCSVFWFVIKGKKLSDLLAGFKK